MRYWTWTWNRRFFSLPKSSSFSSPCLGCLLCTHLWCGFISSLPSGLSLGILSRKSSSPPCSASPLLEPLLRSLPSGDLAPPRWDQLIFLNQGKLMSPSSERVTPGLQSTTLPTSPRSLGLLPSVPTSTCPSPSLLNRCKILWLKCFQLLKLQQASFGGGGWGKSAVIPFLTVSCLPLKIHMFWAYVGTNTQTYWLWKRHIFCTPWHLLVLVKHIALLFMFQHGQKTHSNGVKPVCVPFNNWYKSLPTQSSIILANLGTALKCTWGVASWMSPSFVGLVGGR